MPLCHVILYTFRYPFCCCDKDMPCPLNFLTVYSFHHSILQLQLLVIMIDNFPGTTISNFQGRKSPIGLEPRRIVIGFFGLFTVLDR